MNFVIKAGFLHRNLKSCTETSNLAQKPTSRKEVPKENARMVLMSEGLQILRGPPVDKCEEKSGMESCSRGVASCTETLNLAQKPKILHRNLKSCTETYISQGSPQRKCKNGFDERRVANLARSSPRQGRGEVCR